MLHQDNYAIMRFGIKGNAESSLRYKLNKLFLTITEYYKTTIVVFTFGNTLQFTQMEDLLLQQC